MIGLSLVVYGIFLRTMRVRIDNEEEKREDDQADVDFGPSKDMQWPPTRQLIHPRKLLEPWKLPGRKGAPIEQFSLTTFMRQAKQKEKLSKESSKAKKKRRAKRDAWWDMTISVHGKGAYTP